MVHDDSFINKLKLGKIGNPDFSISGSSRGFLGNFNMTISKMETVAVLSGYFHFGKHHYSTSRQLLQNLQQLNWETAFFHFFFQKHVLPILLLHAFYQ